MCDYSPVSCYFYYAATCLKNWFLIITVIIMATIFGILPLPQLVVAAFVDILLRNDRVMSNFS